MAIHDVTSNRYLINSDEVCLIPQSARIFAEAAASYIHAGGCNRYLPKITPYLGTRLLTEIVPYDVRQLAERLLPTQSNATRLEISDNLSRNLCQQPQCRPIGGRENGCLPVR